MTIASALAKNTYTGTGLVTVYPYTFKITDETHLEVIKADANGNETTLVLTTDYTVSGVGVVSGGNVTLVDELEDGYTMSIARVVPLTQSTDLENQGTFYAQTHEDVFDRLTMISQQLQEELDRCPKIAKTTGETADDLAENIADQINTLSSWYTQTLAAVNAYNLVTDLEADVAAAGATDTTLVISDTQTLTGNLTVPANVTLDIKHSGVIALAGYTLTINGRVVSGIYQIFSGSGTVNGTPIAEYVYPQWFGAKGDGATEDTEALIGAIKLGGRIFLPRGTYITDAIWGGNFTPLVIPSGIDEFASNGDFTIEGEGPGLSILKVKDEANADILVFKFVDDVCFKNFSIDGNSANQSGAGGWRTYFGSNDGCCILVRDANRVRIENVVVDDALYFGFNISSDSNHVTIERCVIDTAVGGIDCQGSQVLIKNNKVLNCSTVGIELEGDDVDFNINTLLGGANHFCKIVGNRADACTTGILVKNANKFIDIEQNFVYDCDDFGIHVDGTGLTGPRKIENINVKNNFVNLSDDATYGRGIGVSFANYGEIIGNQIEECNNGMRVYTCEYMTITDNYAGENEHYGCSCIAVKFSVVQGNRFVNNNQAAGSAVTDTGLIIDGGENISVTSNALADYQGSPTQYIGLYLDNDPTELSISNNIITGNTFRSVGVGGSNHTYTFDSNITDIDTSIGPNLYPWISPHKFGGNLVNYGTDAPTTGTWSIGDRVYNTAPSTNESIGWVCVSAGTPGTWEPFGGVSGQSKRTVTINFAYSDQPTTGSYQTGVYVPDNAVITSAWYDVVTTFAGDGDDSSTIGVDVEATNDIVTDTAISAGGNIWDAGMHEGVPQPDDSTTFIKTTAQRQVLIRVAINATDTTLTAGNLTLVLEYVITQ